MKRAIRRHHKRRMKAKAVRIFDTFYDPSSLYSRPGAVKPDPKRHEKLADHIAHCSGSCCGNPRRWFNEKTMQERRHEEQAYQASEA